MLALAVGALAFSALGVAIGSLAREVRAASLLAFLLSLPLAFLALVPERRGLAAALRHHPGDLGGLPVQAVAGCDQPAINDSGPSIAQSIAHLAALIVLFGVAARAGLKRFA